MPSTPRLALSLLLLLTAWAQPASADVFESYRQLEPYVEAVSAQADNGGPLTLNVGHLMLTFNDGELSAVRSSAGRHVGWYFRGSGRYVYKTEDPADQALLADNLQRAGGRLTLRPGAANSVFDELTEALILQVGIEFSELAGRVPSADAGPTTDNATRRGFESMWKAIKLSDLEFDHDAAVIDTNGPPDRSAYIEIVGSQERVAHIYDEHRYWIEQLVGLRKLNTVDYRFFEWLSTQVIPGRGQALADLTLNHADLRVVAADNKTGTIGDRLTLQVVRDRLQVGVLTLINNRDPKSDRWQSDRKACS